MRKINIVRNDTRTDKTVLQIDLKTQSDYVPIPNQIDMIQVQIIKNEGILTKNTTLTKNYNDLITALSILRKQFSDINMNNTKSIKLLKEFANKEKSEFVSNELRKVSAQAEVISELAYEVSYVATPNKLSHKILLAFIGFLFIILAYVVLENKFKEYNKQY